MVYYLSSKQQRFLSAKQMEQWLHQEPHFHQALVLYFCATINPDLVSMVVCRCNRMQPTREFNQENECDQNQSMGDTQHFYFFLSSQEEEINGLKCSGIPFRGARPVGTGTRVGFKMFSLISQIFSTALVLIILCRG